MSDFPPLHSFTIPATVHLNEAESAGTHESAGDLSRDDDRHAVYPGVELLGVFRPQPALNAGQQKTPEGV